MLNCPATISPKPAHIASATEGAHCRRQLQFRSEEIGWHETKFSNIPNKFIGFHAPQLSTPEKRSSSPTHPIHSKGGSRDRWKNSTGTKSDSERDSSLDSRACPRINNLHRPTRCSNKQVTCRKTVDKSEHSKRRPSRHWRGLNALDRTTPRHGLETSSCNYKEPNVCAPALCFS